MVVVVAVSTSTTHWSCATFWLFSRSTILLLSLQYVVASLVPDWSRLACVMLYRTEVRSLESSMFHVLVVNDRKMKESSHHHLSLSFE